MTMGHSLADDRVAPKGRPPESIFLWGAPRSGKSGFAGSLYGLGLAEPREARWTAHPRDALDEYTHEELKRAYRDLERLGYRKTNVRTPAPLRLIVRKRANGRDVDAITLSLVDPAGEWVTDAGQRASLDGVDVHRRAAQSTGLIWLVEPAESAAERSHTQAELLPQLIALLEASGGRQIDIPVAICLSMIDRLSPAERDGALADARSALSARLGESVTRWFEALCPEHRYFAISSAGLARGTVDPINVSEVLDWVVTRGRQAKLPSTTTSDAPASVEPNRMGFAAVARRSGMLAFAALAGWGTYAAAHRAPPPPPQPIAAQATSSGEVAAAPDTIARRAAVRPQGHALPSDSVGATEAFRRLARASGAELARWADTARARATRAIESRQAGARAMAPMHYIRARACGAPMMHCDRRQVIEDYTWVRAHGTLAQREEARRALDTLLVRSRRASR